MGRVSYVSREDWIACIEGMPVKYIRSGISGSGSSVVIRSVYSSIASAMICGPMNFLIGKASFSL